MSRSQQAARYGALIEKKLASYYSLEIDRDYWRDGFGPDGDPWEVKAAMRTRATGYPGRFRVFREPHERLSEADGWYAFAVYRCRGKSVQILSRRAVRAREIRIDEWSPSNHNSPNREAQHKFTIEEIMR